MGSLASTTQFTLSFTSYNPDITSDYRQGFSWQRSTVSLLGYNQIILYPSLSVSYYPALGPSFFTTDIRKLKALIIRFSPLEILSKRETIQKKSYLEGSQDKFLHNTRPLPIQDIVISVEPPNEQGKRNEPKDTKYKSYKTHYNNLYDNIHYQKK